MEKQTLIWTALPNGIRSTPAGPMMRLSVYVTVRLYAQATPGFSLKPFSDLVHWTEKVKNALRLGVKFDNGPTIAADQVRIDTGRLDLDLWPALFSDTTPVKPYEFEDLQGRPIRSYPVSNISTIIHDWYSDIAVQSPDILPTAELLARTIQEIGLYTTLPSTTTKGMRQTVRTQPVQAFSRQQVMSGTAGLSKRLQPSIAHDLHALLGDTAHFSRRGADAYQAIAQELSTKQMVMNGSPMASKDFLQLALFLTPRSGQTKVMKGNANKQVVTSPYVRVAVEPPKIEFHEALSLLGDYPEILARLGLVLDLELPYTTSIPASGKVSVVPSWGSPLTVTTTDSCPKTLFESGANVFRAVPKGGGTNLKGGLLDLSDKATFDLVQLDVDGAAMKLLNFAGTLENQGLLVQEPPSLLLASTGVNGLITPGNLLALQHDLPQLTDRYSLPSLRTAGISLVKKNRPAQVIQVAQNAAKYNATVVQLENAAVNTQKKLLRGKSSEPEILLGAEDLVRGYRVDVFDATTNQWYSLCKRFGVYQFTNVAGLTREIHDEGIISMGLTETADQSTSDLYLQESLFKWDGWSLVAPRPGKIIDSSDHVRDAENAPATSLGLSTKFEPEGSTLPRLRFGRSYRLRVRTVDLAGNGLTMDEASGIPGQAASAETTYTRFEPVASPALVLRSKLKPGESLERLVVRSNYDKTTEEYASNHGLPAPAAERHMLPPQVTASMVETHGLLDGMPPAKSYELVSTRDSALAPAPNANKPDERFNYETAIVPGEMVTIPYLPDPFARKASLLFFDRMGKQIGSVRLVDFYRSGDSWPDPISFRVRVVEGTGEPVWEKDGARVLTVYLPKAETMTVKYSSVPGESDLDHAAIWSWLGQKRPGNLSALRDMALQGRHWMISPYREMLLVHAVQQPLTEPAFPKLVPMKTLGATFAELHGKATLDGKSSERIDVRAEWEEPVDDLADDAPKTIQGRAHVFELSARHFDQQLLFGDPHAEIQSTEVASLVAVPSLDHASVAIISGSAVKALGKAKVAHPVTTAFPVQEKKKTIAEPGVVQPDLKEKIPAEQLFLTREAPRHEFGDTKFRKVKYFAVATTRFREYFLDLIGQTKQDATRRLVDPASQQPPLPLTREGSIEVNVLNSGVPQSPKVLYVIPTFKWERKDDDRNIVSKRCGGGLRVYMERPWYSSGDGEQLGVILKHGNTVPKEDDPIRPYVTQWGLDPTWNPSGVLKTVPSLADFSLASHKQADVFLPELAQMKVAVAGHDVAYDTGRKLWYSDLVLDSGQAYYPFVRLALARYQPNSIPGAHISRVIQTEFVQLVPDRSAAITLGDEKKITIQVAGIYATKNQSEKLSPLAELSRSQRMVFSLEKRVADDDLGWLNIGDAAEVGLAPTQLYGSKMLWSREWKLPDDFAGLGGRQYRVVVKEYEMYTDENGKIASRLVYADAIEL